MLAIIVRVSALLKARGSHKYIERKGTPGNYVYKYADDKSPGLGGKSKPSSTRGDRAAHDAGVKRRSEADSRDHSHLDENITEQKRKIASVKKELADARKKGQPGRIKSMKKLLHRFEEGLTDLEVKRDQHKSDLRSRAEQARQQEKDKQAAELLSGAQAHSALIDYLKKHKSHLKGMKQEMSDIKSALESGWKPKSIKEYTEDAADTQRDMYMDDWHHAQHEARDDYVDAAVKKAMKSGKYTSKQMDWITDRAEAQFDNMSEEEQFNAWAKIKGGFEPEPEEIILQIASDAQEHNDKGE